uniref:arylamine N-acetyltransferase n=1 Tax=Phallusia mammillata TaxID=59560 RepID=A0A6F9DMJ1_9ASCI|nr:arylamine N-acetyltransferase 2 [Phallusia mammillata]
MDVQKYLQRIEYTGSRVANLDNLNQLCWCHATHVPQYTLDLFGGEGKQFDLENIYHKIVQLGLGGFCYELNGLFGNLLKLLGYKIELLQGSCFMQSSDEFNFPFDHLLLKVCTLVYCV